ncbi:hypothetical protein N7456_000633 [Penicillium angulare]|uniref:LysM domain-containing protein n=1 Tax=Penicillium angulare TaxID=116970 RepID=A0A9W9KSB0_9EURO|nr:hypothetical protein N7456_000633 [Penicillium angulare]
MGVLVKILILSGLVLGYLEPASGHNLKKRDDTCSSILVGAGDTCDTVASKCGITTTELEAYNTDSSLCTSLEDGKPICCSSGALDLPPTQRSNGVCYTYTIQAHDTCGSISQGYDITIDNIETYNKATYAWYGCDELELGGFMCLSSGAIPMPVAIPQAVCGPQVPGTARPDNMSDLSALNPCLSPNEKCDLSVGKCVAASTNTIAASSTVLSSEPTTTTTIQQSTTATVSTNTVIVFETTFVTGSPTIITVRSTVYVASKDTTQSTITTQSTLSTQAASTTQSTSTTESASTTESTSTTTHSTSTTKSSSTNTKTSSDASSTNSVTWIATIYSEANCEGDYYVLQGTNTSPSKCLDISGGNIPSASSDTEPWCRWYTDGGLSWTSCDQSTITTPGSFWFTLAECTIYNNTDCDSAGDSGIFGSEYGLTCVPTEMINFAPRDWISMTCNTAAY